MNTNKVTRLNGEQGQVIIAVLVLLAIIVVGMIWVMQGMGVNPLESVNHAVSTCPAGTSEWVITYVNGAQEVVCR